MCSDSLLVFHVQPKRIYEIKYNYRISSPISLVIFSVFDTEICEIFHQKRGSAYSQGFGIKENC